MTIEILKIKRDTFRVAKSKEGFGVRLDKSVKQSGQM